MDSQTLPGRRKALTQQAQVRLLPADPEALESLESLESLEALEEARDDASPLERNGIRVHPRHTAARALGSSLLEALKAREIQ